MSLRIDNRSFGLRCTILFAKYRNLGLSLFCVSLVLLTAGCSVQGQASSSTPPVSTPVPATDDFADDKKAIIMTIQRLWELSEKSDWKEVDRLFQQPPVDYWMRCKAAKRQASVPPSDDDIRFSNTNSRVAVEVQSGPPTRQQLDLPRFEFELISRQIPEKKASLREVFVQRINGREAMVLVEWGHNNKVARTLSLKLTKVGEEWKFCGVPQGLDHTEAAVMFATTRSCVLRY